MANTSTKAGVWWPGWNGTTNWNSHLAWMKARGMNHLFLDVGNIGQTSYPTTKTVAGATIPYNMPYNVRDVAAACQANNVRLHLWFQNMVCSNGAVATNIRNQGKAAKYYSGGDVNEDWGVWWSPAVASLRSESIAYYLDLINYVESVYPGIIESLHLDYIRYGPQNSSYNGSYDKPAFEAIYGAVGNWPGDVAVGSSRWNSQYRYFQRNLIRDFVASIHDAVTAAYPAIKISGAVWCDYDIMVDSKYQAWGDWNGKCNIFIPMSYCNPQSSYWTMQKFQSMNARHAGLAAPQGSELWQGIYTSNWNGGSPTTETIMDEAEHTLGHSGVGFVLFWDESNGQNFYDIYWNGWRQLPNLAAGASVSASSSEGGYPAGGAVDSWQSAQNQSYGQATRWSANASDNEWIKVDLSSAKEVRKIVLKWLTNYHGKNYTVDYSQDNNNWTNIITRTNYGGGNDIIDISSSPVTGRYFRMNGTLRNNTAYAMWEFQVFGLGSTSSPIPVIPGVPTNAGVTATSTGINLSWSAPVGTPATGYNIYYATTINSTFNLLQNTTATTASHSNLTAYSRYYYKISAIAAGGESGFSNLVSAQVNTTRMDDTESTVIYDQSGTATLFTDNFARSDQSGWGNGWSFGNVGTANWGIESNQGSVSASEASWKRIFRGGTATDTEILIYWRNKGSTNDSRNPLILARAENDSLTTKRYQAGFNNEAGTISIIISSYNGSNWVTHATRTITNIDDVNYNWYAKFYVKQVNSTATDLKFKFWRSDQVEPAYTDTTYGLTAQDTATAMQNVIGTYGITYYYTGQHIHLDDFIVNNLNNTAGNSWYSYSDINTHKGAFHYTDKAAVTAQIAFTGTNATLMGTKGPNYGHLGIKIDGVAITDGDSEGGSAVDMYYAGSWVKQDVIYTTSSLASGAHIITIQCTGQKNNASSNILVSFDALDYYTSTIKYCQPGATGTWANAGSSATPCSVLTALNNARAGNTVYHMDGIENFSTQFNFPYAGTQQLPIVFTKMPGTTGATIQTNSGSMSTLWGVGRSYVTLEGFTFQQAAFDTSNRWSTYLSLGEGLYPDRIIVRNCTFKNSSSQAIIVNKCTNTLIDSVTAYYQGANNSQNRYTVQLDTATGTVASGCTLYQGRSTIVNAQYCNNTLIEKNTIYNQQEAGADHEDGIHVFFGSGYIIRNNIIYVSDTGSFRNTIMIGGSPDMTDDVKIYNNMVWNASGQCLDAYNTRNLRAYNNTFVTQGYYNNIVIALQGAGFQGTNIIRNNVLYNNHASPVYFDTVPANVTQDHNYQGDPGFVNNALPSTAFPQAFHLAAGALCQDQALVDADTPIYDYLDKPRWDNPNFSNVGGSITDLGAFEYIAPPVYHYVATTGTASWAAATSSSAPCSLLTAFANAVAGDIVYLFNGYYDTNGQLTITNNGNANQRIIFQNANGNTNVWIRRKISDAATPTLYIDKTYITFNGINYTADTGAVGAGAYGHVKIVPGGSYFNWINFTLDGNAMNGFGITIRGQDDNYTTNGCYFDNFTIKNMGNYSYYESTAFAPTYAKNITATNFTIGPNIYGDGMYLNSTSGVTIKNGIIHGNIGSSDTSYHRDNVQTDGTSDLIFENVLFQMNSGAALGSNLIFSDGQGKRNKNIRIANCHMVNNGNGAGIDAIGGQSIQIYNNTFYVNGRYGMGLWENSNNSNFTINNNIFHTCHVVRNTNSQDWGTDLPGAGSNNLFYNYSIPAWSPNSKQQDPLLYSISYTSIDRHSFDLTAGSPCINAGLSHNQDNLVPLYDCYNNTRDSIADIGAMEFGATGGAIPSSVSDLSATASTSSINLSWSTPAGNPTGYNIYYASSSTASFTLLASTTATTYNHDNLQPYGRYYYRVTAKNSSGESSFSNLIERLVNAIRIEDTHASIIYNSPAGSVYFTDNFVRTNQSGWGNNWQQSGSTTATLNIESNSGSVEKSSAGDCLIYQPVTAVDTMVQWKWRNQNNSPSGNREICIGARDNVSTNTRYVLGYHSSTGANNQYLQLGIVSGGSWITTIGINYNTGAIDDYNYTWNIKTYVKQISATATEMGTKIWRDDWVEPAWSDTTYAITAINTTAGLQNYAGTFGFYPYQSGQHWHILEVSSKPYESGSIWRQSFDSWNYSGGSQNINNTTNAYVDIPFTGTYATILGLKGPTCGIMKIGLKLGGSTAFTPITDGDYLLTGDTSPNKSGIDIYNSTWQFQVPLYTTRQLAQGSHILRLTNTGIHNASATDTYISLDAFEYWGVTADATAPDRPLNMSVSANASANPVISWTSPMASDLAGINIYRSLSSPTANYIKFITISSSATTSYADTSLTYGTSAYYYVTAYDTNGNESLPGLAQDILTTVTTSIDDTTISNTNSLQSANAGGSYHMDCGAITTASDSIYRSLIKINNIPVAANSQIINAYLSVYCINKYPANANVVGHRILRDWGEGIKDWGAATTDESNWTYAKYPTYSWLTAGVYGV